MARTRLPNEAPARAEANGYRRGYHRETDRLTGIKQYGEKELKAQDFILDLYVTWCWKYGTDEQDGKPPAPVDRDSVRASVLRKGAPAPLTVDIKDFLRFYVKQSKGRINTYSSVKSVLKQAEPFFKGFARVTGTLTVEEEKSEVYKWVKRVLPTEGDTINQCLPKHNFGQPDLDRILLALWTRSDLKYHERYKIQFTFLIHTYCWTGARINAFFKGGLRYKDIHLVLRRRAGGHGSELIWKIDQRWVKNNRNPNTVVFSAAGKEHSRLLYNDGAMLLTLASADKALFGFDSLEDLWQQEIPPGETHVVLRWKESVEELPILRQIKKGIVTEDPWLLSSFTAMFREVLDIEGYSSGAGVHQIRRDLGKKVDRDYTEVERSQHILQSDPRIFGQSYVANTSSVDGQAAFLQETADHSVIEYFQGLEQFREPGAPIRLPKAMKADLEKDPEVVALQERASTASDSRERDEARKARERLLKRLEHRAFISFRHRWTRERRDWKILTRGKVSSEVDTDNGRLILLIPERARIADKMKRESGLTMNEMRDATRDLLTLCTRDYTVFFRPGEEPINGLCPVCNREMHTIEKRYRSDHIHGCCKKERANEIGQKVSCLRYCYDCMEWYVQGSEWDEHCQRHLSDLPKILGTMTYCSTLIKPAFCPFHLATNLPASERMQSWERDADALRHMKNEHLGKVNWPSAICCDKELEDEQSFYYHLSDCHGYSLQSLNATRKRKRQDDGTGQAKKKRKGGEEEEEEEKVKEEKYCEVPAGERALTVTRREADPTLPVINGDDTSRCSTNSRQAFTDAHALLDGAPHFRRAMSLCSSVDGDSERLGDYGFEPTDCFISRYVNPSPSPTPSKCPEIYGPKSQDPDCFISHFVKLPPPSPTPPAKDEHEAPLNRSLATTDRSIIQASIEGSYSNTSDSRNPKGPRIKLKLNHRPPKIILRLGEPSKDRRRAGKRQGGSKRRGKA